MDTIKLAKRMVIIVFVFITATQAFYTFRNIQIFKEQYEQLNEEQALELGKVIENYFSIPIELEIPLERIGGIEKYLYEVLETTLFISSIKIVRNDIDIFSAEVSDQFHKIVTVPIHGKDGQIMAEVRLGIISKARESSRKLLIDLVTIIVACLVYSYELLIFIASFVIIAPNHYMIIALRRSITTLQENDERKKISGGFEPVLLELERKITPMKLILHNFLSSLERLAAAVMKKTHPGKTEILSRIEAYKNQIETIIKSDKSFSEKIIPAHVRPIVATFILAANLQSSFLPVFTKELLSVPTFFDSLLPQEILAGLPITLYMITVTSTLMLLGTNYCSRLRPYHALTGGLAVAAFGFVSCGFASNIIHLIAGRMMCAVGFSMVVFYCRKYIVENSTSQNRTLNLAGYTAAFSGGMLCSIVVGGIITEYFSYKAVFFLSAGMLLIVLKFAHMVFGDYSTISEGVTAKSEGAAAKKEEKNIALFMKLLLRDSELVTIFIQGIVTRIVFIGFFYYMLPIFLKQYFSFSDIGRIMIFYAISSILLSTWLNRFVKGTKGNVWGIFISNLILGISMCTFILLNLNNTVYIILTSIGVLLILGISNSITFPSQVNLLLETKTARQMGTHTPMAVFQSVERVGSALGPVVFGAITMGLEIHQAVGIVGGFCVVSAMVFLAAYRKKAFEKQEEGI